MNEGNKDSTRKGFLFGLRLHRYVLKRCTEGADFDQELDNALLAIADGDLTIVDTDKEALDELDDDSRILQMGMSTEEIIKALGEVRSNDRSVAEILVDQMNLRPNGDD